MGCQHLFTAFKNGVTLHPLPPDFHRRGRAVLLVRPFAVSNVTYGTVAGTPVVYTYFFN